MTALYGIVFGLSLLLLVLIGLEKPIPVGAV